MQILIEGGDGAGKTTLARSLSKATGIRYFKFPTKGSSFEQVLMNPEATDKDKSAAAVLDFKYNGPKPGEDAIMDRGFISTLIYQNTSHALMTMTELDYQDLVREITHFLILDVDPKVGRARELQKNTMSATSSVIYEEYMRAFNTLSLRLQYQDLLKIQNMVHGYGEERVPRLQSDTNMVSACLWDCFDNSLNLEYKVKLLQTTHLKEEQAHEEVLAWLGLEDGATQSSGNELDGGDTNDGGGGEAPAEGTYAVISDSNSGTVPGAYGEDSPF